MGGKRREKVFFISRGGISFPGKKKKIFFSGELWVRCIWTMMAWGGGGRSSNVL